MGDLCSKRATASATSTAEDVPHDYLPIPKMKKFRVTGHHYEEDGAMLPRTPFTPLEKQIPSSSITRREQEAAGVALDRLPAE